MKHRDLKQSVRIYHGIYSYPIYEMEIWSLKNEEFSKEEYERQLKSWYEMDCGLQREGVGLYRSKKEALEFLDMMYDDPYGDDRELHLAFLRERALCCMMQPEDYLKEWTYLHGILHDESIVRNYDEENNPFFGRPKEMIHFKRGDIVMIPDGLSGHWGIVGKQPFSTEITGEESNAANAANDSPTGKHAQKDYTDDSYIIIHNSNGDHEHILSHRVLPAVNVPDFVRETLEEGLEISPLRNDDAWPRGGK